MKLGKLAILSIIGLLIVFMGVLSASAYSNYQNNNYNNNYDRNYNNNYNNYNYRQYNTYRPTFHRYNYNVYQGPSMYYGPRYNTGWYMPNYYQYQSYPSYRPAYQPCYTCNNYNYQQRAMPSHYVYPSWSGWW